MRTNLTSSMICPKAARAPPTNVTFPINPLAEREPMLYVDVNLGNSGTQRIVVFEGDTAEGLA